MEIILKEQRNIDFAIDQIRRVDLSKVHVVTIKEYSPKRSEAQNKIYWLWCRTLGDQIGMTKDEMHIEFKGRYVLPVLLTEGDEETTEMNEAIKVVWQAGLKQQAITAKRNMIRHTVSTTKLTVKQFTVFLNDIEQYARDGQIALPYPPEYDLAMGIKNAQDMQSP